MIALNIILALVLLCTASANTYRDAYFRSIALQSCQDFTIAKARSYLNKDKIFKILRGDDDTLLPLRLVDGILGYEDSIAQEFGFPFSFREYLHSFPLPYWAVGNKRLDDRVRGVIESFFEEDDRVILGNDKVTRKAFISLYNKSLKEDDESQFCPAAAFNLGSVEIPYIEVWRTSARLNSNTTGNPALERRGLKKWVKKKLGLSCMSAEAVVLNKPPAALQTIPRIAIPATPATPAPIKISNNEELYNKLPSNLQSLHIGMFAY
jgi:hypothetical protein